MIIPIRRIINNIGCWYEISEYKFLLGAFCGKISVNQWLERN